ncbi:unnamed protein product [Prunus armeniaca]
MDDNKEVVDQLMKDLKLLHMENMAPWPILECLGMAKDVLNLQNCYENFKPSFSASEFWKTTHKVNLVDYQKQKAELDALVTDYNETKSTADKLEKDTEDLQKQLATLRERQKNLEARLGAKTKSTFLVQSVVSASRPTLEIAKISIKKAGLQETLKN